MKPINLFLTIVLPLLFMSSCNDIFIEKEGGSEAPKFQKSVSFGLDGGSITILSQNNAEWYFSNFRLHNDSVVNLEYLKDQKEMLPDWAFLQNIEVATDVHDRDVVNVKTDWFSLYKIDNKTMDITVEPSEEARQFKLYVSNNRDAGMYITVVQKDERN